MAEDLYGRRKPAKVKGKEISSSNSSAFSSNLASLISSSSATNTSKNKHKPSRDKEDIFTAHKSAKKRTSKAIEDENGQKHRTRDDIGSVSTAELHRSKRRMEEKVRLYNAMKRGEYVGRGDGYDDRGLVDFDRKWAEQQHDQDNSDLSDSSDDGNADDNEEVEYLDDFGRLRKGTKRQAAKEERKSKIQALARQEAQEFAARPQMPSNVIYGDAVQHQAFNPEKTIAEQMAELARKRDNSATPPPSAHFDANAEVRTKGTGFYTFSHDAEERKREMDALEATRRETEEARKRRGEAVQGQSKNDSQVEGRTAARPAQSEADRFLDELVLPAG